MFWLRGRWERLPLSDADLYIAQRFFIEPTAQAKTAIGDRLRFVDAILPFWAQEPSDTSGNLIVVYPGGLRSPVLTYEYQENYLSWISTVLETALNKAGMSHHKLVTVVPPQLMSSRAVQALARQGQIISAGVNVLGDLFKQARSVVVAPGIETMLEASALGLTPHYLPAYNGSHIPQLIAYREAGVGDELCPSYGQELKDLEANTDWLNKLTMDVSARNLEHLHQPHYMREAADNLVSILQDAECKKPAYPLGRFGASQIAELIIPLFRQGAAKKPILTAPESLSAIMDQ